MKAKVKIQDVIENLLDRVSALEDVDNSHQAEFDARVKASLDRMQASGFIIGDGDFTHCSVPASEPIDESNSRSYTKVSGDWVMTTKADPWNGSETSSSYPSKEEIRSVLHTLCAYAYDNLSSFRVVAKGIDGVGNGVLQFGVDAHPEDLEGSTFEQLVERLAAYSPNKDELSKDKQAAKAEFFGDRVEFVSVGGSSLDDLTNEEWVESLKDYSPVDEALEKAEKEAHADLVKPFKKQSTLPPHIMRMVEEANELDASLCSFARIMNEFSPKNPEDFIASKGVHESGGSTLKRLCNLQREIGRETLKHFGGES